MELSSCQRQILNRLIDKYEDRQDYGQEQKSNRRTMIPVNKREHPEYFHVSDSAFRLEFNQEMTELESQGLVELEWVRFDRGNTLRRIILCEDYLPLIYQALDRYSKAERYARLRELFIKWQAQAPHELQGFYGDVLHRLTNLESLPASLRFEQEADYQDFLMGLHELVTPRQEEVLQRQFSVQLYGNSKRFEKLKSSVLWVLKTYMYDSQEALTDDQLLSEHNIILHPHHVLAAGEMSFQTKRGKIDLGDFFPDVGLSPQMIAAMEILQCGATAVVTVENLTSYYHYLSAGNHNHLVIYLGGYHNHSRRLLLVKLYDYFKHRHSAIVPFYHWGDIDLGGFQIWNHLREKTGIPVKPILMDEQVYLEHLEYAHPMSATYQKKLARLLENPSYQPFHRVIEEMLSHQLRLEQEAITDISSI